MIDKYIKTSKKVIAEHKEIAISPSIDSAIPIKRNPSHPSCNPTVRDLLKLTIKHTETGIPEEIPNFFKEKNDSNIKEYTKNLKNQLISKYSKSKLKRLLRFLRKKQRGNSIDSNYGIWKKANVLDVLYQTARGLQTLDMTWVLISKENVEYNLKYAGKDSPDYIIMKHMYEKYGEHYLGEDGQQTYSVLDFAVRPLLESDLKEENFDIPIVFREFLDTGSELVTYFPRSGKDTYKISDWPEIQRNRILDTHCSIAIYECILWRHIEEIFEYKNISTLPEAREKRTVNSGLISLATSYITSTVKELAGRFEEHEKSMPLELDNINGKHKSLGVYFKPLGVYFEKWCGDNVRCDNEELLQKLLLFERKRGKAKADGDSPIVTSDTLNKLVKKKLTPKTYKDVVKELQAHCGVLTLMFECFEAATNEKGMKKNSSKTAFLADFYRVIVDNILHRVDTVKVDADFDGREVTFKVGVSYDLNDKHNFIEKFLRQFNKIITAHELKKDNINIKLTPEEDMLNDIYSAMGSFKGRSLHARKEFWDKWFDSNKDEFIANGTLLPKDLKRFFSTREVVAVIDADDYKTLDGEFISPSDAWDGTKFQGDHWEISYVNGGFTILSNCKGLGAKQNKIKGRKNAKEYVEELV